MREIDKFDIDTIVRLYDDGHTQVKIAELYGTHQSRIWRILQDVGKDTYDQEEIRTSINTIRDHLAILEKIVFGK